MGETQESTGRRARPQALVIVACLARAGRFRDAETAAHVERMSRGCGLIARQLGLGRADCRDLMVASTMHDIGKIGLPDSVLRKPQSLTREERALIETHPQIGYKILSPADDPVLQLAATVALTHHERIDGSGYPLRLRGERIPLAGRIAAVADVFDALTHDRPYRPALGTDDAWRMVEDGRGTHFDPRVLDAFESVLPEILEIRGQFPDGVHSSVSPASGSRSKGSSDREYSGHGNELPEAGRKPTGKLRSGSRRTTVLKTLRSVEF